MSHRGRPPAVTWSSRTKPSLILSCNMFGRTCSVASPCFAAAGTLFGNKSSRCEQGSAWRGRPAPPSRWECSGERRLVGGLSGMPMQKRGLGAVSVTSRPARRPTEPAGHPLRDSSVTTPSAATRDGARPTRHRHGTDTADTARTRPATPEPPPSTGYQARRLARYTFHTPQLYSYVLVLSILQCVH